MVDINEKLVLEFQQTKSPQLISELWARNTGLVRIAVKEVVGNGSSLDFEDALQESYIGFYSACETFVPGKVRFSTYIVNRIKWHLISYFEENVHPVRIPAYMQDRVRSCVKKRQELEGSQGRYVSYKEALADMGLSNSAVDATLTTLWRLELSSLDAPFGESGDECTLGDFVESSVSAEGQRTMYHCTPEEVILDKIWREQLHDMLVQVLEDMPPDLQSDIVRHWFGKATLFEIARERGETAQATSARIQRAFEQIRTGEHGQRLAEFLPCLNQKSKADRMIEEHERDLRKLKHNLSESEARLLA